MARPSARDWASPKPDKGGRPPSARQAPFEDVPRREPSTHTANPQWPASEILEILAVSNDRVNAIRRPNPVQSLFYRAERSSGGAAPGLGGGAEGISPVGPAFTRRNQLAPSGVADFASPTLASASERRDHRTALAWLSDKLSIGRGQPASATVRQFHPQPSRSLLDQPELRASMQRILE